MLPEDCQKLEKLRKFKPPLRPAGVIDCDQAHSLMEQSSPLTAEELALLAGHFDVCGNQCGDVVDFYQPRSGPYPLEKAIGRRSG